MPKQVGGAGGGSAPAPQDEGRGHQPGAPGVTAPAPGDTSPTVKPRGAANPTPPTGAQIKQNFYEQPDAAKLWHSIKTQVMEKWPNWTAEQHDKAAQKLMKLNLAEAMQFTGGWIEQTLSVASPGVAERMPVTLAHAAVTAKNPLATGAITSADQWLVDLYGGENVGPVLSTFLIDNDRSAEATRGQLEDLAGIAIPRHTVNFATAPTQTGVDMLQEILAQEDPVAAFKALTPEEQAGLQYKIQQVMDQGQAIAGSVNMAHTILNSGDFSLVLSQSDLARINEIMRGASVGFGEKADPYGLATDAGRTNDLDAYTQYRREVFLKAHPQIDPANVDAGVLNRMIGIDQYTAVGKGKITIDEEWAQLHPDKAAALKVYLEQAYPGTELAVGRRGVMGSAFEAYNYGIDNLTAPVGAGLRQVSELVERINVGPFANHTAEMTKKRDELQKALQDGTIPKNEIEDAQKRLNNYNEDLSNDVGWTAFQDTIQQELSTEGAGMGFGTIFAQSIGINPGDSHFALVAGVAGIVSQIAADPINWVTAGAGAWLKASYIPKFLGEARTAEQIATELRASTLGWSEAEILKYASKTAASEAKALAKSGGYLYQDVGGFMTQRIYRSLAKTPEELAATKRFSDAADAIQLLKDSISTDHFTEIMAVRTGNRQVAVRLAKAQDVNDLKVVLTNSMTGNSSWRSVANEGIMVERASITKQLREMKYSPDGVTWEAKVDDLETLHDDIFHSRRATRSAELDDVERELDYAKSKLEDYQASHWDLRQRRAYLTDIAKSKQVDEPLIVLNNKTLRRIRSMGKTSEPRTALENALVPVEDMAAEGLAPAKMTARERLHQAARTYAHPWTNFGYGHEMAFEGPGGVRSLQELHKFAVDVLNVPEDKVAELLAPLANGSLDGSYVKQFDWIHSTWQDLVNQSDLPEAAKQEIANMYRSREGPRAGGLTNEAGQVYPTPTLYDQAKWGLDLPEAERAGGIPAGWPSISAREVKGVYFKLPSLDQMYEWRGFTRNLLHDYAEAGRAKRIISGSLGAVGKVWNTGTNIWRDLVLIPRMFGALPARIFLEQQARIAAYGEASLFFHPLDWFKDIKKFSNMSDTELKLFVEAPEALLGGITDSLLRSGYNLPSGAFVGADDERFVEGVNQLLREWFDSPETARWHLPNLGDPEATLRAMHDKDNLWLSQKFLDRYDELSMDHLDAIRRTQQELLDHIGTGKGADIIRSALANDGKAYWASQGKTVKIGSEDFQAMLEEMRANGTWAPATKMVSTDAYRYVSTADRSNWGTEFRDWAYRTFYSRPDLYLSRSPLFRGIATREFKNLRAAGYDVKAAKALATDTAAARTADMMFTIGAHTTGEHFLKSFMPFFPAWRELGDTWVFRLPTHAGRIGEAVRAGQEVNNGLRLVGWGMGAAKLAHRGQMLAKGLEDAGILKHDANGNLVIPFPALEGVLANALGVDVPMVTDLNVGSLFGMFPFPEKLLDEDHSISIAERFFGASPSLGAPPTLALGALEKAFGEPHWTNYLNDIISPYGMDPGLTTTGVGNLFTAAGQQRLIFWENGAAHSYREAMILSTLGDGLRMYTQNHPVPDLPEGIDPGNAKEMQHWHDTVLAPWFAAGIDYANRYKTRSYLAKGIIGSTMPMTIQWTDEGAAEMQKLWDTIKVFQDTDSSNTLADNAIKVFFNENPKLEAYMTGKYINRSEGNSDDNNAPFSDAVKNGTLRVNDIFDLGALMVYNNSRNLLANRRDTLDRRIRNHDQPVMHYLLDGDVRHERSALSQEIQDYTAWAHTPESKLAGGLGEDTSHRATAGELYDEIQKYRLIREGADPEDIKRSLTHQQQAALDVEDGIRILDLSLDPEDPKTQLFYKKLNNVHELLAKAYGATDDPFWLAVGKFYDTNGEFYIEQKKLYKQLTGDSAHDAIIYNQLRNVADRYGPTHAKGFDLPGPEQYSWANKTPEEQEAQKASWASLPGEFLTEFQKTQVYGDVLTSPRQLKASHAVANLAFRAGQAEDKWLKTHTSDRDKEYADQRVATAIAAYAKEKGVAKWWAATQQPVYTRIGNTLNLGARTNTWNVISAAADTANAAIIHAGFKPSGQGELATQYYESFAHGIKASNDPELKKIINEMSFALARGDMKQLTFDSTVQALFFGVYYNLQGA